MRLAVAQLDAEPLRSDANALRGARAIDQAADQGADMVVLPELQSSGYVLDHAELTGVAEEVRDPGPALRAWCDAATRGSVIVVAGFAERGADGELFDSAVVIDSSGAIVGVYRKLHLFAREHDVFAPGDLGLPIFEVDGVRVGVLICYDLRFPEAMRVLALRDAQIVAVPAAWVGDFDLAHPREGQPIGQVAAATVQANLNQVFVVAADRVGTDGDVTMLGSSTIASPYGEYLTGPLDRDTERVVVTEVDLDDQLASRARGDGIRPREDRRPDVYGDLLGYREQDATRLLSDVEGKRGYLLNMHRILAESDPEFLHAYEGLMTAAYTRDRLIDRRTAEFIYVAVLTALGSSEEHLIAHMQAAITAGATSLELLQVLEQTLPPAGVPRFMAALDAWEAVCGQASDRSQPEKARLA